MRSLIICAFTALIIHFACCIFDNEINLECTGRRFNNVTLTAYYPDFNDEDHERAFHDSRGNPLKTLQDFVDDRNEFVTLSMDADLRIPYGTPVCIPELNLHFGHRIRVEVRDSSSELKGAGFKRAEICVRSETDSYDNMGTAEEERGVQCSEQEGAIKSNNCVKSEEVFIGKNFLCPDLLDCDADAVNIIDLEAKCTIRHVSTDIVADIIRKRKDISDSIFQADQQESDLVAAVYEGGLKIWQCTYDLLNYLYKQDISFEKTKILDLGCGAGILGLYAYLNGADVYFQDYNAEVLRYITIPNLLLNNKEEGEKATRCRFYSGDWKSFREETENDFRHDKDRFDYILTSETIYNCDNYVKLNELFKTQLKSTGKIFLAAKVYYFGVGGGLRSFEDMINADDVFQIENCWKESAGVQREIISLTFKQQPS